MRILFFIVPQRRTGNAFERNRALYCDISIANKRSILEEMLFKPLLRIFMLHSRHDR
jgi:hypothetical protein